jgi:transcriptional regulator with XRE-family HTH domain
MDGLTLKICRIRLGVNQWQLGQKVGLIAARVSEMERGQRPVSEAVARYVTEALENEEAQATA